MAVNPNNIWRVPAYLPYLQPPLTDQAISDAEAAIGYTLPPEYIALLRVQNGGCIRYSLPDSVHDTIAGIGPNFPSLTGFDWDDVQEYVSFPLQGLVPFDGDGHWHMCFDYRQDKNIPSIAYVDVECDSQSQVAPSFDDYLNLLFVDHRDQFAINDFTDFESAMSAVSRAIRSDFSKPDSWAHGYPISRASLNGDSDWCWLSPNQVRHGFVRNDDPRYDSLKDVLPDLALRYPELTPTTYILNPSDGARDVVLASCRDAGLTITPLSNVIPDSGK